MKYTSSKLWKNVTVQSPLIWSQIHLAWRDNAISTFMHRNGRAPLSIGINEVILRPSTFPTFKNRLQNLLSRAERLSFVINGDPLIYTLFSSEELGCICQAIFNGTPRPSYLQRLHIELPSLTLTESDPMTLANLPRLTTFHAQNLAISPNIPFPSLLTHVEIKNSNMSFDIITFFSCVPLLEIASFIEDDGNANPPTSLKSPPDNLKTPITTLPQLKKLSFQWYHTVLVDTILRTIQCPTSAEITIITRTSQDSIILESVPECLRVVLSSRSTLSLSLESTGSQNILSLDFKAPNSSFHHLELVHRVDLAQYMSGLGLRSLKLTSDILTGLGSGGYSLREICKLSLSFKYFPSAETLTQLFGSLLNLEELSVQTRNVNPLLTALGSPSSTSLLCPVLSHLDLRRSRIDLKDLRNMLQARKDLDCRISRLKITVDPRLTNADEHPSDELFATASSSNDTPIGLSDLEALVDHFDGDKGYWSDSTVQDRDSDWEGYSDYSYDYDERNSGPDSDYWRRQNSD